MLEDAPAWLTNLPADRPFVLLATLTILLMMLARALLVRTSPGRRALQVAHSTEAGVLALLLFAMIIFSFVQIALRNLVQGGVLWIDPLLRHLVLWVGFLGSLLATRYGRHINVDALSRFLPRAALRVSRVATNLLAALVCLLLSNACLKMVRDEALAGTTDFLDLPIWQLQLVMPIASLLMSYRFLGHAWGALQGRPEELTTHAAEAQL